MMDTPLRFRQMDDPIEENMDEEVAKLQQLQTEESILRKADVAIEEEK